MPQVSKGQHLTHIRWSSIDDFTARERHRKEPPRFPLTCVRDPPPEPRSISPHPIPSRATPRILTTDAGIPVKARAPVAPDPVDPVEARPPEVPPAPLEPADEGSAVPPVVVVVVAPPPVVVAVVADPPAAVVVVDDGVVVVDVEPDGALHAHWKPSGSVVLGTEVNVISTSQ